MRRSLSSISDLSSFLGLFPTESSTCRDFWEILPQISGQTRDYYEGGHQMLKGLFLDHPAKARESYFEHMAFAVCFSWRLVRAGLAAFVHGIFPACCETTASSEVLAMNEEIRARRALVDRGAVYQSAALR